MYIGNIMLLILNIPSFPVFRKHSTGCRYVYLAPAILVICIIGVYTSMPAPLTFYLLTGSGLLGYFCASLTLIWPRVVMAMVLGQKVEINFRRAMDDLGRGTCRFLPQSMFPKYVFGHPSHRPFCKPYPGVRFSRDRRRRTGWCSSHKEGQ